MKEEYGSFLINLSAASMSVIITAVGGVSTVPVFIIKILPSSSKFTIPERKKKEEEKNKRPIRPRIIKDYKDQYIVALL